MTDLSDFVRRLVGVLDRLGLPYMFVGSAASTLHGPPRSTQNIGLVGGSDVPGPRGPISTGPPQAVLVGTEYLRRNTGLRARGRQPPR